MRNLPKIRQSLLCKTDTSLLLKNRADPIRKTLLKITECTTALVGPQTAQFAQPSLTTNNQTQNKHISPSYQKFIKIIYLIKNHQKS